MRVVASLRPTTSLLALAGGPGSSISAHAYSTHSSFSNDLIDRYDGFVLDQFGVLHNGAHALDGAVDLVEHLSRKKKKKLVILSNTSAPSDKALLRLPKLGFDRDHFIGAVTSGEEAARYIRKTFPAETKTLFFTWDASDLNNPRLTAMPQAFLDHCGNLEVASSIEEADMLLLHGSEVWYRGESKDQVPLGFVETGDTSQTIDQILRQCIERNIPVVCANPDVIVQTPTGGTNHMPGGIAERYRELGGANIRMFGKPEAEHFEACLRTLDLPADRVVHVGDSIHHDIVGAIAAGIPSIFVSSGIHLSQLGSSFGELPDKQLLDDLFEQEGGIVPTHVVPAFRL